MGFADYLYSRQVSNFVQILHRAQSPVAAHRLNSSEWTGSKSIKVSKLIYFQLVLLQDMVMATLILINSWTLPLASKSLPQEFGGHDQLRGGKGRGTLVSGKLPQAN